MNIVRDVIVFDAADLHAESTFWAGILGGHDLHVDDPRVAHEEAIALGARLLQPAPDQNGDEGHQVYADPAGHPFCIGWGHPSRAALARFVADRRGRGDVDPTT